MAWVDALIFETNVHLQHPVYRGIYRYRLITLTIYIYYIYIYIYIYTNIQRSFNVFQFLLVCLFF